MEAKRLHMPDLRDAIAIELAKSMAVPMSLVDGRPWVATHDEAHPEG